LPVYVEAAAAELRQKKNLLKLLQYWLPPHPLEASLEFLA
jgi:hypothetical protein